MTQIVEITVAITELHLISPADPAPVQFAVIKVGLNTTDDKKKKKKKKMTADLLKQDPNT